VSRHDGLRGRGQGYTPLVVASLNGRTGVVEALNAAHSARPPALLPASWWDSTAPVSGPAPAPDGPARGPGSPVWLEEARR
jgi:hypothetical protein